MCQRYFGDGTAPNGFARLGAQAHSGARRQRRLGASEVGVRPAGQASALGPAGAALRRGAVPISGAGGGRVEGAGALISLPQRAVWLLGNTRGNKSPTGA